MEYHKGCFHCTFLLRAVAPEKDIGLSTNEYKIRYARQNEIMREVISSNNNVFDDAAHSNMINMINTEGVALTSTGQTTQVDTTHEYRNIFKQIKGGT